MPHVMDYLAGKKAILFDMDGVLWHSAVAHARAYAETLVTIGVLDADYRELAGKRTDEALLCELARRGIACTPELVKSLVTTKRRLALGYLRQSPPVADGCLAVLKDLRLRCNLALVSSASPATVRTFLDASGTQNLFDAVLTGECVRCAKPAPDIYRAALARLGLQAADALVIEDAISGIEAANQAGIDVLAITGTLDRATLESQQVVGVIDRLEEIRPWPGHVLTLAAAERAHPGEADPAAWTAVIPAAGRGSRLGFSRPKILFPVLGRPLLEWLLDLFEFRCDRFVFVLSPSGKAELEPLLANRLGRRAAIVVQEQPTGMGDAVLLTRDAVQTPHCCVAWSDQVLLSGRTVQACLKTHQESGASLTMPTVIKADPYIHFQRGDGDRIVAVCQAREGEIQGPFGENDCGFFAFQRTALFEGLSAARRGREGIGQATGEFDLLQAIPAIGRSGAGITTIRIDDPDEALGINTLAEAGAATIVLRDRHGDVRRAA